MTFAQTPQQLAPPTSPPEPENVTLLPNDLESDEPPLESDLHRDQIDLLLACLKWCWRDRNDFYATGNLTIYYSQNKITTRDFRGPDFFVVLGAENHPRRSWMLWAEEGKYPNFIIEFLSNSTAKVDRTTKKKLYQDTFRTPEYFWFHPETLEFKGFRLMGGEYEELKVDGRGWLWSEQLELFVGIHESQLRFFSPGRQLILGPDERAAQAEQQAETERQERERAQKQAEAERQERELAQQQAETERQERELAQQQVEQLRSRLRELGIDP
ncbi:MAG: Uma2 family endonuclease [Cyanobacteriota bacterium]|nr:Uma2 family endonuclease [Cyanobacteriota bacterium]